MERRDEKGFRDQNITPKSSSSPNPRFEQNPPQNNGVHQRQYSPPPFHTIPHESRNFPQPDTQTMNGVPLNAFRPIYDSTWQSPPSPPKSSTRSRLADEQLVRPQARFSQSHQFPEREDHRHITRYQRRSRSLGYESDSSYETRRHSRNKARSRGGRSHKTSKAGNQIQGQPQPQPDAQKTGLEAIVTPLRLGILLGCFDIIGGSLSVWMTRKRFGKAAAQQIAMGGGLQQQATGGDRRSHVGSKHRRRSTTTRRGDGTRRYHPYDSETGSETDSDYDERLRRTAEHVREQRKLEYERDRGIGRGPRDIRDTHGPYVRRR